MKRLVIGILAHVDSGKTTLSEGLLYIAGEIKKAGRVDHKNTFLDTNEIERDRGITIFSKQAQIKGENFEFTLLDTPGHVDFSAEAERTLQVLDYAILVISASDGVQSHTLTLWKMLQSHNIPTFIFVNKTDLPNEGKESLISILREKLSDEIVDFTADKEIFFEACAMCTDDILDEYMNKGIVSDLLICDAVATRKLIPCYFGSALKIEGVEEFLDGLIRYTIKKNYKNEFGAKVFKISEDEKGKRLTHLKITQGSLKIKNVIKELAEKVNEIRVYSGAAYSCEQEVFAGSVCTVCGLTKTFPGQGLGIEPDSEDIKSEPVFSYSVILPDGFDNHVALGIFEKLEEEETRLCVDWNSVLRKISIRIMGEVQLEVLKRILKERFSLDAEFEPGGVVYKETIANKVLGVGHYEPLRHYAEVHLLIEPGKRGSGLVFATDCSDDILDKNWKRLILTHLEEKTHIGVLTGSPVTDMKITVVNGRAHIKHTEGGDFREATYRAVRHGLMQAESILLEPWYNFILEIPTESIGRAMTDFQVMGAEFEAPVTNDNVTTIRGAGPIVKLRDYQAEIISYTKGRGRLHLEFKGYEECKDADNVINNISYNPEADTVNTPDSVFCSHGAGHIVKWDEVFDNMHIPAISLDDEIPVETKRSVYRKIVADDNELLRIFEQTYGKVKQRSYQAMKTPKQEKAYKVKPIVKKPDYLLIDAYNIIYAWDMLRKIAEESIDDAREVLISKICNYRVMKKDNIIIVFDAYKVKGEDRKIEKINGVSVVYTKEAETADSYIEKTTHELSKNYSVRVATSDNLEQMIIFGEGAIRVTPSELLREVEEAEKEIRDFIRKNNAPKSDL